MATGQTPAPAFKRGKGQDALAYGEAASANDLIAQLGPNVEDDELYQPAGAEEEFLFGPTDRPEEPITAGAPFGPGPSVTRARFSGEPQMAASVAAQIRSSANVSKEARAWAARVQAGE